MKSAIIPIVPTNQEIGRLLKTAVEHHRAGRLPEAEPIYRRVLAAQPRNIDALYLLGLVTQATQRYAESVELFQRAVKEQPTTAKYLVNLGLSLGGMGLGRTAEAIETLRKAVAVDPNIPEAWSNLGNEFRNDLQFEQAIECYQKALALRPNFADAQCNLGVALQETQPTLQPAIAAFEKAIAMDPTFATAHWNLGFSLLLLGDFSRGLPEYEWRWKTNTVVLPRNFRRPHWFGEPLAGRRIYLHAEQGLGDTIHMARYVPLIAERGGIVTLECPAPLIPFLKNLPGLASIIPAGQTPPDFDVHCPLMSLPLIFQTTLETIPRNVPYLHPEPQLAAQWAQRIPPDPERPRVGLVWAGQPSNKNDRNRSIRLDQFAPLAAAQTARFFSVQKGAASEQARTPPAGMEIADFTSDLHTFADTAAMLANLDLIVTVDTAVAHVAGAIGRPVWILIPFRPDWRWMVDRDDSPWYPSMRIFRQKTRGDWADVIDRVKNALVEFVSP
jgi:Flp pilus assembly protein TadD